MILLALRKYESQMKELRSVWSTNHTSNWINYPLLRCSRWDITNAYICPRPFGRSRTISCSPKKGFCSQWVWLSALSKTVWRSFSMRQVHAELIAQRKVSWNLAAEQISKQIYMKCLVSRVTSISNASAKFMVIYTHFLPKAKQCYLASTYRITEWIPS